MRPGGFGAITARDTTPGGGARRERPRPLANRGYCGCTAIHPSSSAAVGSSTATGSQLRAAKPSATQPRSTSTRPVRDDDNRRTDPAIGASGGRPGRSHGSTAVDHASAGTHDGAIRAQPPARRQSASVRRQRFPTSRRDAPYRYADQSSIRSQCRSNRSDRAYDRLAPVADNAGQRRLDHRPRQWISSLDALLTRSEPQRARRRGTSPALVASWSMRSGRERGVAAPQFRRTVGGVAAAPASVHRGGTSTRLRTSSATLARRIETLVNRVHRATRQSPHTVGDPATLRIPRTHRKRP